MSSPLNVGVFIYANADIMDFSGPVEVYSTRPPPNTPKVFNVTTFAHTNPVGGEHSVLVYVPGASFSAVERELENYDILVIPGAHPDVLEEFLPTEYGQKLLALLRRFATLPPRKETGHRILQSVCSGAIILGAAGVLEGRTATTHHSCYGMLKEYADKAAGGDSGINVVKKRWVDGGKTEEGVRIVNAGGVSSGIDASLWVTELVGGKELYKFTEEIMEFERRGEGQAWGVVER
ncbi:class I glutamine amidotransferase-like protein [Bimuria novae-zelandiae CBS 107.79]|uniref:Class I glutamine amidotransferase-like protein n=1 Tax=Bimuria novae-zelandiae CBS 107.79 TaxID=1447943 RepID=A0A6A5US24_9PLEO|nr:class I glutamine amidotransferase-like protein [Bimuria novae-zelandiae CBS 107.79]